MKIPAINHSYEVALGLNYRYDPNGNVIQRNNNHYSYDELDRLKTAEVDGTFLVEPAPANYGHTVNDYFANAVLDYQVEDVEVDFDYAASTIGLKFSQIQRVDRIELIPEVIDHRVDQDGIRIFYRQFNDQAFTEVKLTDWVLDKDAYGKVIIILKSMVEAGEIKIHSNYDQRDMATGLSINQAAFSGVLKKMIRVFGKYDRTKITYDYDAVGNRTSETYTNLANDYNVTYSYDYYAGSNRLKEKVSESVEGYEGMVGYRDGFVKVGPSEQMAYQYDQAGNMITKGSSYNLNGDQLSYTDRPGKVHWEYKYNSRNRLNEVWKNGEEAGEKIASYGYDFAGQRLKVVEGDNVTYTIYNYLGKVVFEDVPSEKKTISYLYGLGNLVAKVERAKDESNEVVESVYYYHQDNLGSTMLMTNDKSEVVFEQDYTPFGKNLYHTRLSKVPVHDVEPGFKYTGQRDDVDTGLYYYNARYYDPEIGRFNREDDYQGDLLEPQTLNLYSYVLNNPMKYIDPTGHSYEDFKEIIESYTSEYDNSINILMDQMELDMSESYSQIRLQLRDAMASTVEGDNSVASIQASLYLLGYDLGTYGALQKGIDGDWGKKTKAAYKDFQMIAGVDVTGKIDDQTLEALDLVVASGLNRENLRIIGESVSNFNSSLGKPVFTREELEELSDVDLVARTIYGEAGKGQYGLEAVAWTIKTEPIQGGGVIFLVLY